MITLTIGDFIVLFVINLILAIIVAYATNYAKRKAELSAEEGSKDKEYVKKVVRDAISEARNVLTELRVHEFNIPTGRRRLSRMNSLVEKLSLADAELGTKVWSLVNAPTLLEVENKTYEKTKPNPEVEKHIIKIKNNYFKDLERALKRCAELEKNPIAE